ncbi:MAG: hypothetical protein HQK49_13195 [Oligoflexia bacterium]|nr:hypothetical protein [Oligoflexia bacterium]
MMISMRFFSMRAFLLITLIFLISWPFKNVMSAVSDDLLINGSYYKKITTMQDLIADILPPPCYIIESYLVVMQILDEMDKRGGADQNRIKSLLEYGKNLENGPEGYLARLKFWSDELKDFENIKDLLVNKAAAPAKEFYKVRDGAWAEAVNAGKREVANKIARTELKKFYEEHRKIVDQIVAMANKEQASLEKVAQEKAASGKKDEIVIKGALYKKIMNLKDVVNDILPPPKYIIELYLVSLMVIDELEIGNKEKANEWFEYGKKLIEGSGGYNERQEYWLKTLAGQSGEEAKIKDLMCKQSTDAATNFFTTYKGNFATAIKDLNLVQARITARKDLKNAYESHRKVIDELVVLATKTYKNIENEVAAKLK